MATLRYWILIVTNNKKLQLGRQHAANELWRTQLNSLSASCWRLLDGATKSIKMKQINCRHKVQSIQTVSCIQRLNSNPASFILNVHQGTISD